MQNELENLPANDMVEEKKEESVRTDAHIA